LLPRSISRLGAIALVAGTIIGTSIFVQPSLITSAVPRAGGVFVVWLIAGVLTLFGALITAELASAYPRAGGVYVFLNESFSPAVGFLWGWAMFWTMHTGIIAAIATVFARYMTFFVPVGAAGSRVIAVAAVAVLTAVNYVGARNGSLVQTTFTVLKLGAIALVIAIAFVLGPAHAPPAAGGARTVAELSLGSFPPAIVAGLFAFGGWHVVTYTAEETETPERTIPIALLVGILVVTASYIALNAAYFHVLTPERIANSSRVAADAADAVLGHGGAALMSGIVAVSTFGTLSGAILSGPRVYLAMGRDGLLPAWAAATHPRFHTPHRAILLQGVWAAVLVSTGTYRALFTRVIYTEWIFFALMAAGLMRLRARADYRPPYRVWGYPIVPLVFILASAFIVAHQLVSDALNAWTGLLFVAAGLPVYFLFVRKPAALSSTDPQHAD
jgi:basic amino acid/polyamine antiporter, APA family